ncbi:hypothetical protein [Asanoa sp. NPDC050611]|uniref:hypothetical protein n=1 Tax=Asanoa sp. NPDC050611 TaxID=3157098 RepID=UPI0033DBAB45
MNLQQAFRDAVGEIPPSSVDVDQVIRRQRRRRRGGLAALVGAAVLGLTVPLAIVAGSGADAPSPASPNPSPTPQGANAPVPAPGAAFTPTDEAVFAAVERAAPDVEWVSADMPVIGYPSSWVSGGSGEPYFLQGPIRTGERYATLMVQLERDWDLEPCTAEMITRSGCVDSTGPAGEQVQTWTNRNPPSRNPGPRPPQKHVPGKPAATPSAPISSERFAIRYDVVVKRPDGGFRLVTVNASGEEAPITLAQLTAVALDPRLAGNP